MVTTAEATTTIVATALGAAATAAVTEGVCLAFHDNQDREQRAQTQRHTNEISLHQKNLQNMN